MKGGSYSMTSTRMHTKTIAMKEVIREARGLIMLMAKDFTYTKTREAWRK